jgi:hypothetical protein
VRIALGAIADQRDPSIERCNIGNERRRSRTIVNAGVAENRLKQRLA